MVVTFRAPCRIYPGHGVTESPRSLSVLSPRLNGTVCLWNGNRHAQAERWGRYTFSRDAWAIFPAEPFHVVRDEDVRHVRGSLGAGERVTREVTDGVLL